MDDDSLLHSTLWHKVFGMNSHFKSHNKTIKQALALSHFIHEKTETWGAGVISQLESGRAGHWIQAHLGHVPELKTTALPTSQN